MKKKIPLAALISDLSGYGRCALTVAIPVLSSMGIQACPMPTAVLTAHTGFPHHMVDFTPHLSHYREDWNACHLTFSAIATGFLCNPTQGEETAKLLEHLASPQTLVLVDPVCGDRGKIYPCFDPSMVEAMRRLLPKATVITPNLTEACLLTDTSYSFDIPLSSSAWLEHLLPLAEKLGEQGVPKVVITGIPLSGSKLGNFVWQKDSSPVLLPVTMAAGHFSGTGDLFAALLCGFLMQGIPLVSSVDYAGGFISKAAGYTACSLEDDPRNGIAFEPFLHTLPILRVR